MVVAKVRVRMVARNGILNIVLGFRVMLCLRVLRGFVERGRRSLHEKWEAVLL